MSLLHIQNKIILNKSSKDTQLNQLSLSNLTFVFNLFIIISFFNIPPEDPILTYKLIDIFLGNRITII